MTMVTICWANHLPSPLQHFLHQHRPRQRLKKIPAPRWQGPLNMLTLRQEGCAQQNIEFPPIRDRPTGAPNTHTLYSAVAHRKQSCTHTEKARSRSLSRRWRNNRDKNQDANRENRNLQAPWTEHQNITRAKKSSPHKSCPNSTKGPTQALPPSAPRRTRHVQQQAHPHAGGAAGIKSVVGGTWCAANSPLAGAGACCCVRLGREATQLMKVFQMKPPKAFIGTAWAGLIAPNAMSCQVIQKTCCLLVTPTIFPLQLCKASRTESPPRSLLPSIPTELETVP
mmetsp:Transcript_29351/g.70695  ORF Transcript_29351/g.70695 Transcript_29351/m.70695 type:complete len:282 (+) Transcript_29351:159-1004(+)